MPAQPKHRQSIVQAAAALFRRRGYSGTGLSDILARSGAPKGSVYHYFPGGKVAIAGAAVELAADRVRTTLERLATDQPDAPAMIREYARLLAGWMAQSAWRDGCPITTVMLETASDEPDLRHAGATAFQGWAAVIATRLEADGVQPAEAATLSTFAIAAIEGALIQARIEQSAAPIEAAGERLATLFSAAAR